MRLLEVIVKTLGVVCNCRYKGESIINAPPATVFEYIDPLPDGPRAKWDSNMKKIELLKWIESVSKRAGTANNAVFISIFTYKLNNQIHKLQALLSPRPTKLAKGDIVTGHSVRIPSFRPSVRIPSVTN